MPFMLLGLKQDQFNYFYGNYIVEYTLILPTFLGTVAFINTENTYLLIAQRKRMSSKIGMGIILFLCLCHRLCAASAIASGWGIILGIIVGLITKFCVKL